MSARNFHTATQAIHGEHLEEDQSGAINPPIYANTTYRQNDNQFNNDVYGRFGNPTRRALERSIAKLEGGHYAYALTSGMSAIDMVLQLLDAGDHIIAMDNLYGGTLHLLDEKRRNSNLAVSYCSMSQNIDLEQALSARSRMLWLESPSNPLLTVLNLPELTHWAHEHNLWVVVDNTFATPYLQNPLTLGADIVVHSATKYLNGHSDVMGGLVVVKDDFLANQLMNLQQTIGNVLSPFDSYLIIRGIKTLALRMEQHCANALKLAQWLERQALVQQVLYPGLQSHPQYQLASRQMHHSGGMVSFYVDADSSTIHQQLQHGQIFTLASSLGDVASLWSQPAFMSHAELSSQYRYQLGINDNLIRLSVGIEHYQDLIADLQVLFNRISS